MPTYDYTCRNCHSDFEIFHSMHEEPRSCCPKCKQESLERRISPGTGIIFKGSGYYVTDSKTKTPENAEKKESKASEDKKKSKETTLSNTVATPSAT